MRFLSICIFSLLPLGGQADSQKVIFGGGCFWCMEPPFEKLTGVLDVVSGYSGGTEPNPSYEQDSSGQTTHPEAGEVTYDDAVVDFDTLLSVFWRQIDPTDSGGQFVDRGSHYRPAIYTTNEYQLTRALESMELLQRSGIFDAPIVTEIRPAGLFYEAEAYHQDYYKTNSIRYKFYRLRSGRDQYLDSIWKENSDYDLFDKTVVLRGQYFKPTPAEIKAKLSVIQYEVTQKDGTEPPFNNPYWNTNQRGIYVDIVSGEPLFSSLHKYDSGTGWPSFWKPLEASHIVERDDRKLWLARTEVRSKFGDSHLGHIFNDGPAPTGLRYCINSASLEFIPVEDLEARGYGIYLDDFT